jgi:transcriptional regulator with XRE-family HTH domain
VGIAALVQQIRRRLGKTQAGFGQLLRCSQNSVSRYESGNWVPELGVLLTLYDLALPSERPHVEAYIRKSLGNRGKFTSAGAPIESLRGLIEESAIEEAFLRGVSESLREKWEPLIDILARLVGTDRVVDESIVEIVRLWETHYKDREMERLLRDVVGHLHFELSATEQCASRRGEAWYRVTAPVNIGGVLHAPGAGVLLDLETAREHSSVLISIEQLSDVDLQNAKKSA